MKLSENFTLQEFTRSATASRLGIINKPDIASIDNLQNLVSNVLQPLRDVLGPIRITSGFRNADLCRAVGSKITSQHAKGQAVDIQYYKNGKMDNIKIYNTVLKLKIDFDQIILEYGDSTKQKDPLYPDWIHISHKCKNNRNQVLVAYKENKNTIYRNLNN